jgi:demethylmenaquinone methyltransferase/2-methoxy-6-polyprenyl-1,4-benzoquinol methylase
MGCSWLDVQDGDRVIDVGTGTGLALHQLAAGNPHGWTVGVDLTAAMIRRARRRMDDLAHFQYELHQARATALPFNDNSFDAVFSGYLVDILPSPHLGLAVKEMARVLRPGGSLVLVYLAPPERPVERLWGPLARYVPLLLGGARPLRLRPTLRQYGLSIQKHTTCAQAGLRSAITLATVAPA